VHEGLTRHTPYLELSSFAEYGAVDTALSSETVPILYGSRNNLPRARSA
jgi:hypothetical protein